MSFLERIRPLKVEEAKRLNADFSRTPPRRPSHMPLRDFKAAISGGGKLIAEVKYKSPSHSEFRQDLPPGRLAASYQRHGAAALSIVTDEANFGTSLADIASLHEASDLPVIAKDFIIDPVQIKAAWAAGADAVLLIVRMLDAYTLQSLMNEVRSHGLSSLVECHDAKEIDLALTAGADLVGINNRNLETLTTDIEHGGRLLPLIPPGIVRVSESGLNTRADILRMTELGADAFLVGHALLMSRDPGRKVAELCGNISETGTRVKICGITSPEDAQAVAESGADILGVIFAESPRRIDTECAVAIRQSVPNVRLCGVFMDQDLQVVAREALVCELDLIQLHGAESPAYCRQLTALTGLPLIKALRPGEVTAEKLEGYEGVAYFMVDLPKDDPGMTDAVELADAYALLSQSGREVFLAGALTPGNVARIIAASAPFGVDVCSGVEKEKGVKDHEKVKAFVKESRP